ncbi:MAG: hypothetical protein PHP95_02085 [Desulfuromonadaceae bacterium]|nr:hypothetical protein [Desulfuromonadaceae bacterium]MDD2847224.1 hypothetical protein [Desulfuromonadaceae bacterium]MDD4130168.1 hypothetical protein [Desulfuromonadaceae bacterium]
MPVEQIKKMKMSFLEFMLLIATAAIQGVILPGSLVCCARYRTKAAMLMCIGSASTLLASVVLAMVRPDVPGRIKLTDFHAGYIQLKSQMSWMYFPLYGGMLLFALATVWLVIQIRQKRTQR